MCITKACEDPTTPGVWWRDDAEWKKYGFLHAWCIRSYMASKKSGSNRVQLGKVFSSKYPRGIRYVVDLNTMKQINMTTGFTRDIKVVNACANAPTSAEFDSIKQELRACCQELGELKKVVHELKADAVLVKVTTSKQAAKKVAVVESKEVGE